MERYTFLKVLAGTLLALAIGIVVIPGNPPSSEGQMPWQVSITETGNTRVFGIELGITPVIEVQKRLRETSEVTLFVSPQGEKALEVYFNSADLGGLKAKLVMTVGFTDEELEAIFERGTRISTQGDGSRKVTLAHEDLVRVQHSPIAAITYITRTRLDEEVIVRRFGEPDERIAEPDSKEGVVHWLYPAIGLDMARDADGRVVLQYVRPGEFERLRAPLRALKQG